MHTKTFKLSKSEDARTQIRCYFAYNKSGFKSKEEWVLQISQVMVDLIEGTPTFIEMLPTQQIKQQ